MRKINLKNILKKTFKKKKIKKIIKKTLIDLGINEEKLEEIFRKGENADMYETNLMRRLSGLLYLDNKTVGDIKEKVRIKKS